MNDQRGDPEFTGAELLALVITIEGAVGSHLAGMTPLGIAVTTLCEAAVDRDEKLRARPHE